MRSATQQQNAHLTEQREVPYRWHPWYGRGVAIVSAMARGGIATFRCRVNDSSRCLDVPQWMFDVASCCRAQLASKAMVACRALCDLRDLIEATERISCIPVLQAEHPISHAAGGAHAMQKSKNVERAVTAVPPTAPLRWINLPIEARERIVALLARLLTQHARARRASGVRDE